MCLLNVYREVIYNSCSYIVFMVFLGYYSRVAQLAEQATVNRQVPGSSPGAGAFYFLILFFAPLAGFVCW